MAIGADHEIAGRHQSLLGEKRVLNTTVVANLEIILYALVLCEIAHTGALRGRLHILVRGKVIRNECDLFAVEHLLAPELRKLPDCNRRGYVVAEHHVELRHHQFPGVHRINSSMRRQYLLTHCHS